MALNLGYRMMENGIAQITLSGELDASTGNRFQLEVEKAVQEKAKRLVLMMHDLEYMASAGLRVLIFAKQKMGPGVDVFVVGAREVVMDTIRKTGLHYSVMLLAEYDAAQIESL